MIDLNRKDRVSFIKSQQRNPKVLTKFKPSLKDMQEGVPIYAEDSSGIKQYIKLNNIMYESALTKSNSLVSNSSILAPNYDSGWTSASLDTTYTFNHNLNSKILKAELYFRAGGSVVWNATASNIAHLFDDPTGDNSGTEVKMNSISAVQVKTADAVIFTTIAGTKYTSGDIRLLLWKTGLID